MAAFVGVYYVENLNRVVLCLNQSFREICYPNFSLFAVVALSIDCVQCADGFISIDVCEFLWIRIWKLND